MGGGGPAGAGGAGGEVQAQLRHGRSRGTRGTRQPHFRAQTPGICPLPAHHWPLNQVYAPSLHTIGPELRHG
eukprot:322809-Prorocentrum_minimum.AAC.1